MKEYENYVSALRSLNQAPTQDLDNDFIQHGIIRKFSQQFDSSWQWMLRLLAYEGDPVSASGSPRDVIKTAYQYYDFMDEEVWLRMLRARNDSAHVYDANAARNLVNEIINEFIPEFQRLQAGIEARYGKEMLLSEL